MSANPHPPSALILPTYNERDNLPRLVSEIIALPLDLQLVIVDDNSPDGTGELADELAAQHSAVSVIHRASKLGLGTAYRTGFEIAQGWGAPYIFVMDADFSHHPSYLPALWARAEETGADLVIGSRYVPGGRMDSPWRRRLLSQTANHLVHKLAGVSARDATAGFRCYRAAALEKLPLEKITSSGYSYQFEMAALIERTGGLISEVPIIFKDRVAGQSKISRHEVWQACRTIWRLRHS